MSAVTCLDRVTTVKERVVEQHRQEMLMERRWRQTLASDTQTWQPVETLTSDLALIEHTAGAREQLAGMIDEFPRATDWAEFQILVLRVCAEDGCRENVDLRVRSVAYVEGREMARRWLVQQVQTNGRTK